MQKSHKKSASTKSHEGSPKVDSEINRSSDVDELKALLREKEEDHARTLAEFDNYRKRVTKEGDAAAKASVRDLLLELLRVQDSFDRAFQSEHLKADSQVYQGVRSIQRQVHQLLEKQGVMSFDSTGQIFNPSLHEAVDGEVTQRVPDGSVLREIQKGYVWEGKVLRPARVVVAKHASTSPTIDEMA